MRTKALITAVPDDGYGDRILIGAFFEDDMHEHQEPAHILDVVVSFHEQGRGAYYEESTTRKTYIMFWGGARASLGLERMVFGRRVCQKFILES